MAPKLRKRGSSVGSLRRAQSLVVESSNSGSVSQGCTPVTLPLQIKESNQCWNDKATGATGGTLAVVVTPPEEGWLSRSASFTAAQFPTPPSVPLRMPAARKRAALVQLNVDDTDAPFSIDAPSSNASAGPSTPCHVVHVVRSRRSSNASAAGSDAQGGEAEVTAGKSSSLLSRTNSLSRSQGGGDRLEARNLLAAAEMQAKEAAVTLRAANLDPKTTLARRWSEAVVLALASRMWHDAHPHAIAVIRRRQRAIAVFRRTIVPMWRDYVERRHRHATQVVSNFILRWVAKLRIRKRRAAAVMIIRFLKHPAQLLSRCAAGYRVRAIRLQRATRALLLRRKAQVELQLLRLRGRDTAVIASQGVEAEYWMQRAGRRCAFFDKSTWLTNLSAKSTDTNMELPRLPVAVLRRRLLDAVTVASRRYHRDILAWERESAFTSAQPWSSAKDLRSTTSGKYAAVDSSPRACNPLQAGNLQKSSSLYSEDSFGGGVFDKDDGALSSSRLVPSNSGGFAAMSQLSRMRRPIFKAFLSKEALFTALDEACRTTAVLRNDPRWAAHLQPQSS